MQPIQSAQPQQIERSPSSVKFSGRGMTPWVVSGTDTVLSFIQENRTREMLFEDLLGFGIFRTVLDLFRQFFFEKSTTDQRRLNFPAARERFIREVGSIFTDNFSGGVIAYGLASLANRFPKGSKNFANQFASMETLELFQSLVTPSANSPQLFIQNLAKQIAPHNPTAVANLLTMGVRSNSSKGYENAAVAIAKAMNPKKRTLDVALKKQVFQLDTLVEDTSRFLRFLEQKSLQNKSWPQRAQQALKATLKVNKWRLPLSLGLAMTMTMAMPYINRMITRKVDGIESYPGEIGLRKVVRTSGNSNKKPWYEEWFPYLTNCFKTGSVLPILTSLVPLPFAFGLFDTVKLSNGCGFKAAFNSPFKKGFIKRLTSMLQFGKGFPFTTQQQMASCFAFLIFSRLSTCRSDIEFRERMVDSFLGWSIWILATPRIKKFFAQRWDKNLLKQVGTQQILKRRVEIERLLPQALKRNTLGKFIMIGAASLAATLAMLGFVEPYAAIKWTEWQANQTKNQNPFAPMR